MTGYLNQHLYAQSTYHEMLNTMYRKTVPLYSINDLKENTDNEKIRILDTREHNEFKVSHIPQAIFVGYNDFSTESVENLNKIDDIIIVYCSVGYRSERIGEKLIEMGFDNVYNLYGGIFEWVNAGYPIWDSDNNITQSIHPYDSNWGKWLEKGNKAYE